MLQMARILLCLLIATVVSHAAYVTNLFNTGVNTNGALLTNNAIDPHWQMASGPGPDATLTNAYVPIRDTEPFYWLPENLSSRWIVPFQSAIADPVGEFRYRTSFDLAGLDPAKTVLHMQVLSDNAVTAVLLNYQVTGITFTNQFSRWSVKDLIGGFQSGTNILEFVVTNNAVDATGFRCELSATDTPFLLGAQQAGENLLLHWPTNLSCYLLESTTNLADNFWVTNATAPTNLNNRFEVTVPWQESARFFRLRRPSAPDPTPSVVWIIYDIPYETYDFSTNCPGSLGCQESAMDAGAQNYLDASASVDWARCSTNDPGMEFVWVVNFPPEAGGATYTLPRISGRNSPILSLPPNCLPQLLPTTREWTFTLSMTSKVDPTLTKMVRFHLRYTGSDMTMQDYQNEMNGN